MSLYVDDIEFVTEHCCNCGMPFAMTNSFRNKRLKDRGSFYCPAGHGQHYTGKSEEQKLRDQLDSANQSLSNALSQAASAERERINVNKAHKKMRTRISNGVCPCCNRTFQNLMTHMKTKHPDFDEKKSLNAIRTAFGMTQGMVAEEAGVKPSYVSSFERGNYVPEYAKKALEKWLETAGGLP